MVGSLTALTRGRRRGPLALGPLALTLSLGGCASFSEDGGFGYVQGVVKERIDKDALWIRGEADATLARGRVAELLAKPLDENSAVQIALLNNRGLQAAYAELGLSEAAYVEASLLPNPSLSLERLSRSGQSEVERTALFDVLGLLTLPFARQVGARGFEQAKARAAEATLRVAFEARRAFYEAVAARQLYDYVVQAQAAAQASADLARKLGETGAFGKLDQARQQAFYAEETAEVARDYRRLVEARERLTRVLGLWGEDTGFELPGQLPAPPEQPLTLPEVEQEALRRRLDLAAANAELGRLSRAYGLASATRFVNVLEAGYRDAKEEGEDRLRGFEIELQVPIFDLGRVGVRQAEQRYMRVLNLLAEQSVNIRSQAREAYQAYRASHELDRHYQNEVVPLRKIIGDESLLLYNGMLVDQFELLEDAREQIASVSDAIDARRDFWLAEVGLQEALIGGGAGGGEGGGEEAEEEGSGEAGEE
jgi:outer membrane protein TolC